MREGVRKGIRGGSLLRWVVSEVNALLDVAFQALDTSLKQNLLVFVDAREHIDCLLGTGGLSFFQSRSEKFDIWSLPQVQWARRRSRSQSPWQFPRRLERPGGIRSWAPQGLSRPSQP